MILTARASRSAIHHLLKLLSHLLETRRLRRVNITLGPKEERLLITGLHSVADIHCTSCNTVIGWKYVSLSQHLTTSCAGVSCIACLSRPHVEQVSAVEESQKYKEGKYILEKGKIMKVLIRKVKPRFGKRTRAVCPLT